MLVNLIFNSTSINGSNNDSTKTIEYYKSENERLKELMKIIVNINKKYNMHKSIPYESAKPMYLVDDIDNQETLRDIVLDTCKDLSIKK